MTAMAGILLVAIGAVALLAPRWAALLLWPVIFLYPENIFMGLLPGNAGLDDIFILLLGCGLLISGGTTGRDRARPVVALALALWLMQMLAEATGLLSYPDLQPEMVKAALKGVVIVIFTVSMGRLINSPRDIERFTTSFLAALTAAFAVVILCFFYPSVGQYWEGTSELFEDRAYYEASWRAFGPFLSSDAAGLMVCLMAPLGLGILAHHPQRALHKVLAVSGISLALLVLVLSKSRSAVIGLGGMFLLMALVSRRRAATVVLMVVVVLAGTYMAYSAADLTGAVESRFEKGRFDEDLTARAEIWKEVMSNPSDAIVVFAEGIPALGQRLNMTPHNGYLDILFGWGLGGTVIFFLLYYHIFRWSRCVARGDADALSSALAWGLMWATVATGLYAFSASPWYVTNYRYVTYFLLTIIYIRYRALQPLRRLDPVGANAARYAARSLPARARGGRE